ncbi:hypothetical protein BC940DRAFT_329637 [Gongronella butleri]|nr:hypothetical protein BC940DRAFT_329637 [Gongronella butleri]
MSPLQDMNSLTEQLKDMAIGATSSAADGDDTVDKELVVLLRRLGHGCPGKDDFSCDWAAVAGVLCKSPGACFRNYLQIFCQNEAACWTEAQDVLLLGQWEAGQRDLDTLTSLLAPKSTTEVDGRIKLLQVHKLDDLLAYNGVDDDIANYDWLEYALNDLDPVPAEISGDAAEKDAKKRSDESNVAGNDRIEAAKDDIAKDKYTKDEKHTDDAHTKEDTTKTEENTDHKQQKSETAPIEQKADLSDDKRTVSPREKTKANTIAVIFGCAKDDDVAVLAALNDTNALSTLSDMICDAYERCAGKCPYCRRQLLFPDFSKFRPRGQPQRPLEASVDHFVPRSVALAGHTEFQITCQQCNYAKSNATDAQFRAYLQAVKDFYLDSTADNHVELHVPLSDKDTKEAAIFWQNSHSGTFKTKKTRNAHVTETRDVDSLADLLGELTVDDSDVKMQAFLANAKIIGLRDPVTGVLGVWDSKMEHPGRLVLNRRDESKQPPYVTGRALDLRAIQPCDKEITLKFTSGARSHYTLDEFNAWLDAIRQAEHNFI